jgi:hypothetical protein
MSERKPISSAPRDGARFLAGWARRNGMVSIAWWHSDPYSAKPRPYFRSERELLWGIKESRENQPTHWQELTPPPELEA